MPIGVYKREKINGWSIKYSECIICGITNVKHNGKGMCKNCYAKNYREENLEKVKKKKKGYREKNVEKIKEYQKKYYEKNREKLKKQGREYYQKNKEKAKERWKKYYEKNREKKKEKSRKWYRENSEHVIERNVKYQREKLKNDTCFKLGHNISRLIKRRLRKRLISKKGKSTFTFLPYTVDELMAHLESLFTEGMTWQNHEQFGWHIDHVKPDSLFNYKSVNDKEFQECWALKNLQPLWWYDNLSKSNKY